MDRVKMSVEARIVGNDDSDKDWVVGLFWRACRDVVDDDG